MKITPSLVLRVGSAIVGMALLAGAIAVFWPGENTKRVVAYFDRAVGLYEGNDVTVLGVPVGEVTAVQPQGTAVRVEMVYEADRKIPADAKAAVVSPTLVSDRYVQLAPAYTGGPVLDDGATIPEPRTATPVELDRIYSALNELSTALGPEGANKDGSLSRLLDVGAKNLEGQGKDVHRTVENLSQASQTLADGSDDLFATVRHLQQFTTMLARSDEQVETFNQNLADVSNQLEAEREELGAALDRLATALKDVERFVRQNKGELSKNVEDLTEITKVLAKEKKSLAEVLNTAPLALSNLALAYNPVAGTLDTRNDFQQIQNPAMYICSLVYSLGVPPKQCEPILAPLNALRAEHLPGSVDVSFLTRLTQSIEPYQFPELRGDGSKAGGESGGGQERTAGDKTNAKGSANNRKGSTGAPTPPRPSMLPDSSLEEMLVPGGNG